MSEHAAHHSTDLRERTDLGERGWSLFVGAAAAGAIGLIAAVILGFVAHDHFRHFFFAYLTNFAFFLSIALGGLFFVLIQHVTRAGWSVTVRRLAENVAATLPVLGALSAPIILAVILGHGRLYSWTAAADHATEAKPAAHAEAHRAIEAHPAGEAKAGHHELPASKKQWLNRPFFIARVIVYFVVWSLIALWYWRTSTRQDASGDPDITSRMEKWSPLSLIAFAVTVTLAAFDLLMSLDPLWYSTIYGVYYFSGAACGIFSTLILLSALLQRWGLLKESITAEHYHDLGKLLFGFVFFWGYIAFSQYMLIWYGNIPEETGWYVRRGTSTVDDMIRLTWPWGAVSIALLLGHLLIPFAGLLSRHVKRRRPALVFWAAWVLIFHWIDVAWLVMPEFNNQRLPIGAMELCTFVGIGGIFVAALVRLASQASLRPSHDPRLHEAVAFQNI